MPTIVRQAALRGSDVRLMPTAAALVALGIVYGDIGTSPLYAFKQAAQAGGTLSSDTILGVRLADPVDIGRDYLAQIRDPDHARR